MKRPVSFIILILFFTGSVPAQFSSAPVTDTTVRVKLWSLYPGYVVTQNGDTLHGYLLLKNLAANQDKVFFYEHAGDKKYSVKYKPKDLKAYKVGPRYYESWKFKPPATASANDARTWHFILKVIDGPFSLYKWYYETLEQSKARLKIDKDQPIQGSVDLSFSEKDLHVENYGLTPAGEFIDLGSLKILTNFKKNMSKLVADDTELAAKIRNKEKGYGYYDLDRIISEYNAWYLKNNVAR
jgi:hypothetical protein